MKSTVVVAVLCLVVTMVTCQKRMMGKCKKLEKMKNKLQEMQEMAKCPQTQTWSACVDGSVTVTYQLEDENAEGCVAKPEEVMPCPKVETITKKDCNITKTMDFSDCATSKKYEVKINNYCTGKNKTMKKPCDPSKKLLKKMKKNKLQEKVEKLEKMCSSKKGMKKDKKGKNKKDRQEARERRRQRKNKGQGNSA